MNTSGDQAGLVLPTAKPMQAEKFRVFLDLGIITMPDDYDQSTCVKNCIVRNRRIIHAVESQITDKNFSNPSRILRPRDRVSVQVVEQTAPGVTLSVHRMDFLGTQEAIYTGLQGICAVLDQRHASLPRGRWFASFDLLEHLCLNRGVRQVSRLGCRTVDGKFVIDSNHFVTEWCRADAFFLFTEVEAE